jgi:hypothetical protein
MQCQNQRANCTINKLRTLRCFTSFPPRTYAHNGVCYLWRQNPRILAVLLSSLLGRPQGRVDGRPVHNASKGFIENLQVRLDSSRECHS